MPDLEPGQFHGWPLDDPDPLLLPRTGGYLRGFWLQTTSYGKGPWDELWGDWPVFPRAWRRRCTSRYGQDDPNSGRLRCRRSSPHEYPHYAQRRSERAWW